MKFCGECGTHFESAVSPSSVARCVPPNHPAAMAILAFASSRGSATGPCSGRARCRCRLVGRDKASASDGLAPAFDRGHRSSDMALRADGHLRLVDSGAHPASIGAAYRDRCSVPRSARAGRARAPLGADHTGGFAEEPPALLSSGIALLARRHFPRGRARGRSCACAEPAGSKPVAVPRLSWRYLLSTTAVICASGEGPFLPRPGDCGSAQPSRQLPSAPADAKLNHSGRRNDDHCGPE
jgi:hypothetical protein